MMSLVRGHQTEYPGSVCTHGKHRRIPPHPASDEVAVQEQALIHPMENKRTKTQDILAWAAKITAITVALLLF
jgi:hypothetical protein